MVFSKFIQNKSAYDKHMKANRKHMLFSVPLVEDVIFAWGKYSLQGTTQGNGLTGADMPVRFSM